MTKQALAILFALPLLLFVDSAGAQTARWGKMSPMLRQLARQSSVSPMVSGVGGGAPVRRAVAACQADGRQVCAFVSVVPPASAPAVLQSHQCRLLAQVGSVSIASIPLDQLAPLSLDARVGRIEARPSCQALLDTTSLVVGGTAVHCGTQLPQPFTGEGVVMGVMDIGFDLSHPTFFDAQTTRYRISRLWDMLSTDTLESTLFVGRDFTTPHDVLALGCTHDGRHHNHGTHTLGIAAGSGHDTPYQGLAPGSDICLVANGTSNNAHLIDSANLYKYTSATDALGFKYIFDYAAQQGRPCVISFSEGSPETAHADDHLFRQTLQELVGPGRILVSAAGNCGTRRSWFRKPQGQPSAGTFLYGASGHVDGMLQSAQPFALRLVAYNPHQAQTDTLLIATSQVLAAPDSLLADSSLAIFGQPMALTVQAYASPLTPAMLCYDFTLSRLAPGTLGHASSFFVSAELVGTEADVEFRRLSSNLETNSLNPQLCAGEATHNVYIPAAFPSVVCVGATVWRPGFVNHQGQWKAMAHGSGGQLADFSSVGPAIDGLTKPDVVAPGGNIISSLSSYAMEQPTPDVDPQWDVAYFDFRGRTYAWGVNSGTSMACPVVAGIVALWLQACPTLSPSDVLQLISQTSRPLDAATPLPSSQWGWGEVDAYRGLLQLTGASSIPGLSAQPAPVSVSVAPGQLRLRLSAACQQSLSVSLYDMGGRQHLQHVVPPGSQQIAIALPPLPPGIYAVQISGQPQQQGSALVRL